MKRIIDDALMENIATYMQDEVREDVHADLAPCSNEEFLVEYCKRDADFEELLRTEFSIDL